MLRVKTAVCAFIISVVTVMGWTPPIAGAESSFSWLNGNISAVPNEHLPAPDWGAEGLCRTQKVTVGLLSLRQDDVCVYQQDGFRYGNWTHADPYSSYSQTDFVVGLPNENRMYRVQGMPVTYIPIPHSKDLLIYANIRPSFGVNNLYMVRNFAEKLIRTVNADSTIGYRLADNYLSNPVFYTEPGIEGAYVRSSISNNGRWLALEQADMGGLIRIDLNTLEAKWFSWYEPSLSGIGGKIEFTISDNGARIVTAGRGVDVRVYEITDSCGSVDLAVSERMKGGECPYVSLWTQAASGVNNDMEYATFPRLNSDGGELSLYAMPIYRPSKPAEPRWVTLTAAGYTSSRLDYLALGDSYSSGEGDIEKTKQGNNFYLNLTDVGNYNCHISSRSYPFLLRDFYNISADKMHSVACSGARVMFDYFKAPEAYQGQSNRTADKNPDERANLQRDALEHFIPGITSQLEFIKKYQPKVVTLTGGGNDVGFADILSYCASPALPVIDETCGFASDAELREMLGVAIRNQYDYTRILIQFIQQASPGTSVYMIGYPSFIAGSDAACTLNAGLLNGSERDMLNESVTYINGVLQRAAQVSGAHYISIEDSLKGGRLCEGGKYVTGLIDSRALIHGDQKAQSFHPNASGHERIAETIYQDKDFSLSGRSRPVAEADEGAPSLPYYFQGNTALSSATQYPMTFDKALAQSSIQLSLPGGTLQSSSHFAIEVYSLPTSLGNFAAESDGSVSVQVALPSSIEPGYHVIVVTGISPSGEAVKYYQFIELRSANSEGALTSDGTCQYIQHWYDETTGNDVCATTVSAAPTVLIPSAPTIDTNTKANQLVVMYPGAKLAEQLSFGTVANPVIATAKDHPTPVEGMVLGVQDIKPIQTTTPTSTPAKTGIWGGVIGITSAVIVVVTALYFIRRLSQRGR